MVKFFKVNNKSAQANLVGKELTVIIERLDDHGRGVCYVNKKAIFIEYVLPDEKVTIKIIEQNSKFIKAKLLKVLIPSKQREKPKCTHFYSCGGCDLQHIKAQQQRDFKQQKIEKLFNRQNIQQNLPWQPSLHFQPYGYRRKSRIGVQYNKAGEAIVGYRQSNTNNLVNIKSCPILLDAASHLFPILKKVIDSLKSRKSIGHIECLVVNQDDNKVQLHLVIRQLSSLNDNDKILWQAAANKYHWQLWFDDGKTINKFPDEKYSQELSYHLLDDSKIAFGVNDFIQVNHQINQAMVEQAIQWLALENSDIVLDLFCGLGNFSLPMAKKAKRVYGIEGVQAMVDKAKLNASVNNLTNCSFFQMDLNSPWQTDSWQETKFSKVLLDPARAGAEFAVREIAKLRPKLIVYVSCEPTTLARDSAILLQQGYKVIKIAIMEMFSQTKHVETMVLFED